jgi:hypothetical protein
MLLAGELAPSEAAPRQGQLNVVTYNVAGLPRGLSNVYAQVNLPIIGSLVSKFDLALVQQDFAYPELLRQRLRLPYRSAPFRVGAGQCEGDEHSLIDHIFEKSVSSPLSASCSSDATEKTRVTRRFRRVFLNATRRASTPNCFHPADGSSA